ncbi:molybdate ABC transporter substrate-binding protein [Actinophytocola xanthii]|uniref:Molybdate ABC transporter substrate-binding protein n=1 Tax=Actinophytocola xanthii TaxID=1912961 RepID=A0A1Q8C0H6_9PSEU|nr:molybdate ABC transporter substrate-binding protein [Actinophytocola xanthii]OLF07880.1 molybdate ABC transporter substrate-binding protein [Actinophytocola xanthii]
MRSTLPAAVPLLLAAALSACGSPEPAAGGEVVVFAAASLTETFTELGTRFEDANPGTTVTVSFGGSSGLATQIVEGAPVDVFASASPATMDQVVEADAVSGKPAVFARNALEIAVPAGNPGRVTGLADFGDEDRTIALCAEQVPCGAAARQALASAGVAAKPDTLEQDVRAVLTKVELGEVDAALVYHTDVLAAGDEVEGIALPESAAAVNDYLVATLAEAPNPDRAAAFVAFVRSEQGRSVLADAGFQAP